MNAPCKGTNCGSTNGWLHSRECFAEHDALCDQTTSTPVGEVPAGFWLAPMEPDDGMRASLNTGPGRWVYTNVETYQRMRDSWLERHPTSPAPAASKGAEAAAMGSVLQRVMARLTDILDDDQFKNIEAIVRDAGLAAPSEPETDMRAICEALGFDPTNHHNAAKCPYCRPAEPEAKKAPHCLTCGDHGAVGLADRSEPCPDCTPPGSLAEAQKAVAREDEQDWSNRYRVERGGLRYCVRAGTGTRGLFFGSKGDCARVARELLTAFRDGQFVAIPSPAASTEVQEVLIELLTLKAAKDRIAFLAGQPDNVAGDEYRKLIAEYERRKPLAWSAGFALAAKNGWRLNEHAPR